MSVLTKLAPLPPPGEQAASKLISTGARMLRRSIEIIENPFYFQALKRTFSAVQNLPPMLH
jgi:hypothetical protein